MKLKDRVLFVKQTDFGDLELIGACTYEFWQEINKKINARNKYSGVLYRNENFNAIEHSIINHNAINKLKKLIEK